MNSTSGRFSKSGFTLTALLVIIAVLAILAAMLLPALARAKTKASSINCVNNLKQVGLAFRIWSDDNGEKYPMSLPMNKGGTLEYTDGADTFRHFQVMSNQLTTPKFLICPNDTRTVAANFDQLENQNVSYFIALEANDTNPQMFLAGDRNLTGPAAPENGILKLVPGDAASWTSAIHVNQGNIGLVDGSVQQCSNERLRQALRNSGDATNVWRIALPE
jgi:type II secretory pathway pseudopilin PulG